VLHNKGYKNGDDGLEVCGEGSTVGGNRFNRNKDWGICVVDGNINAGFNFGWFNDTGQVTFDCPVPPQCDE